MKHKKRRYFLYIGLKIVQTIAYLLPYKLVVYLGSLLGKIVFYLMHRERKKTIRHLRDAFLSDINRYDVDVIAKEVFINLGKNFGEWLKWYKLKKSNIDKFVTIDGLNKIKAVLAQGKGLILVTAHFGNWELLAAYFGLKGYKPAVVARKIYYDKYDQILVNMRKSKDVQVVYRDASARVLLKILKDNRPIGILPDQDVKSIDGIFIDFFGKPAFTPTGPVKLALVSGAPILTIYIIRTGYTHKIVAGEPIYVKKSNNKKDDIKKYTQIWSKKTEEIIREYPSQWVWMHRRWRTTNKKLELS